MIWEGRPRPWLRKKKQAENEGRQIAAAPFSLMQGCQFKPAYLLTLHLCTLYKAEVTSSWGRGCRLVMTLLDPASIYLV